MGAEEYRELEPYILLSEKVGTFASQLFEGAVKEIKITYAGDISQKNTTPLTLAALKGFLPVPIEELTREFAEGATSEEICARSIRTLTDAGVRHFYISNLPLGRAALTLHRILEKVDG